MRVQRAFTWSAFLSGLISNSVWAHAPDAHIPGQITWNPDPLIVSSLILCSLLYAFGYRRLSTLSFIPVRRPQAYAFAVAIATLALALISPIDTLSEELSWVHMVQHTLLMAIAAPLFVAAAPAFVMIHGLPRPLRRSIGRTFRHLKPQRFHRYIFWQPLTLWLVFALALWIWHLPSLYEAALLDGWVHNLQHLSFFVASALFWRILLDPISRFRLNRGLSLIYLFMTSIHAMILGVLMALSPRLWYGLYKGRTEIWNLTPMEDQQLAGLIMWMPACFVYIVAAGALFWLWLTEVGQQNSALKSGAPSLTSKGVGT